jgi:general secretion pathway protein G
MRKQLNFQQASLKQRNFKQLNHKQAGFTLIEIMVVVIILGILGALIVPNILGRTEETRITAAKSDIRAIGNALTTPLQIKG